MSKLTDLIEKNLEQSIKESNKAVKKSMKTETKPGAFTYLVAYIIVSLLYAWWASWIIPHFTDKVFGFWQLAGSLFFLYMITPNKIAWIPTTIAGLYTIYIWLFL